MGGLKFTSPGILLIFAIISAAGIFLLDTFFLHPYVDDQAASAMTDRAIGVEKSVGLVISGNQDVLLRSCENYVRGCRIQTLLKPSGSKKEQFRNFAREVLVTAKIDYAWFEKSGDGEPLFWSRRGLNGKTKNYPSISRPSGKRSVGIVNLPDGPAIFACKALVDKSDGAVLGYLSLARRVDMHLLDKISLAIDGEITFVVSKNLPELNHDNITTSRVYWPVGDDELAAAWLVYDSRGKILGYFRAIVPVGPIHRQVLASRRTVLIVLSLSVGLVLLVIMGVHILVAGPVVRLMRRLQQIEAGHVDRSGLTDDLHGEPLAVAQRLETAFDKLDYISKTDQLTNLANRRHFELVLQSSFEQAKRYNRPLSVMILDIDYFKAVNDSGGHHAGDDMIKAVAEAIDNACRKADIPARFGGDEFAILMPESAATDVGPVAERISKAVAQQTVHGRALELKVTISIGIADLNSGQVDSPQALVALADRALYAAKELGRNRHVMAHDLDGLTWPSDCHDDGKVNLLSKKLAGLDSRFKNLFINAVEEVIEALEERNPHMVYHARRVKHYSVLIAREMELPSRMIQHLGGAAMLHDIGMLALPDSVLLCPDELNEQQWQIMQKHPLVGARILEGMEFLEQEIPAVKYHHERYDGKGYPEGMCGAEIPLPARIIAVADAFVAMTASRTFREAMSLSRTLEEMKRQAGVQFDPVVVEAFLSLAERLGDKLLDDSWEEGTLASQLAVDEQPGD